MWYVYLHSLKKIKQVYVGKIYKILLSYGKFNYAHLVVDSVAKGDSRRYFFLWSGWFSHSCLAGVAWSRLCVVVEKGFGRACYNIQMGIIQKIKDKPYEEDITKDNDHLYWGVLIVMRMHERPGCPFSLLSDEVRVEHQPEKRCLRVQQIRFNIEKKTKNEHLWRWVTCLQERILKLLICLGWSYW